MRKEFFWNIKVDGTRHEIRCEDRGNSFDVLVDDEFRFNIRSDINLDIEEDLTVGSKRCRIVVYRGVPDLAVDGILMDAEAQVRKQERRSRMYSILGGVFMVLLGIFAAWNWVALRVRGEYYFGGIFAPIFALLVFVAGIGLILWTVRKREY